MSELTVNFDDPYIGSGPGLLPPIIPPWAVAVNGRRYLLDTAENAQVKYRREGIDVLQQRNTNNNRDLLLLPQDIWRQQQESWHQGAGQVNLDREEALPYRFHRSYGINPWTRYELTLLNETTKIHDLTTPDPAFVQVHNGVLVGIAGTGSVWYDTNTTHATLTLGASSGKAVGVTYNGDAIIVLTDANKIYELFNATTSTARPLVPPAAPAVPNDPAVKGIQFIAYVKDYLLIGVGNQLWDITDPAKSLLIFQSPVTGFTWKGAAEGHNAIYAIGGAGDRHVIHRIGINENGTLLTAAIVAAMLPDGERGTSIGSYLGYVFVGSDKGVRMATAVGQADLVLGALIPSAAPVLAFEGQDRFVWVTWGEINALEGNPAFADSAFPAASPCGLARMDLSIFTVTQSTPAYATDLVAEDQTGKVVQSVTTWNDKRAFTVNGGGIYVETDNKMKGGWLTQGRISYSVEDLKTALYCQAKWEPLAGAVAIDISYDNEKPVRVMYWGVPLSVRSGNIPLNGKQFSRVDLRYVLYRDTVDIKTGPTFTRFEFRARAVKGAASRWTLPLINHEELDLNGIIEARDVTEEFKILMALVESGIMFPLQEWGSTYNVVAKDFSWWPQKLDIAGSGWQGVFALIVEECR